MIVVALLLLLPALYAAVRRPSLRRLATRNVSRRRGEAALVIAGSLLGTAIISAALIVDDTIASSIRDFGRTRLGPVDETVSVVGLDRFPELQQRVNASPVAGTDGVLAAVVARASVATAEGPGRRAEPDAAVVELDFDAARRFGGDAGATGLSGAGATPSPGEAVVSTRLARHLGVTAGDRVDVFAYRARLPLTIRQVVPEVGLAGFSAGGRASVLVAPGTLAPLAAAAAAPDVTPPTGYVLVSNTGGVYSGVGRSDAVEAELAARISGLAGADVQAVKKNLLRQADEQGKAVGELYTGIGGFSVIAGILLLVNLFVMLAEERKVEIGMLRAVGFRRSHVMRAFGVEGAIYSVVASAIGATLGIGVGWVITKIAEQIITKGQPDLSFRLDVRFATLLTGFGIGLFISLATVWLTSWRISRGNVIAAIRDLPEPRKTGRSTIRLLGAGLLVGGGLLTTAAGIGATSAMATIVGVPLAALGVASLLGRVLPRKPVVIVAALVAMAWALFVFNVLTTTMAQSGIEVFIVQGVVLVGGAVTVLTTLDRAFAAVLGKLSRGGGLPTRLGLAYPLARRFRTGMLLGMYALVIFTMTFLSVFSGVLARQTDDTTADMAAGFEVVVDANPSNPVTAAQLAAEPGVDRTAAIVRGFPQFTNATRTEPLAWPVSGIDAATFAGGRPPALGKRLDRFASDADVFAAVVADPSLIVVDDIFLAPAGGGPGAPRPNPGDTVTLLVPGTGERRTLTVAGVLRADWGTDLRQITGSYASTALLQQTLGPRAVPSRVLVSLAPGTDAAARADDITGRYLANGADARTVRSQVQASLSQFRSFLALMRGYLALGLLIGIAGLGVVMVRAVRERRREIGMMRAMGIASATVRRAFLLEAAFIALQGIVIGVGLGLVSSWSVLVNSDVFGEGQLHFVVPPVAIAGIVLVPFVASLLATAAPATQAARIKPAVALRVTD